MAPLGGRARMTDGTIESAPADGRDARMRWGPWITRSFRPARAANPS